MSRHHHYFSLSLILFLLSFAHIAKANEKTWIINVPEYQVSGSNVGEIGGSTYTTGFTPCVGSSSSCLVAAFGDWVGTSGMEGYTRTDYAPNSDQYQIVTYSGISFLSVYSSNNNLSNNSIYGELNYAYNMAIEYYNSLGQYGEADANGTQPVTYTIQNCPNPNFPFGVDSTGDGLAEICYKKIPSCGDKSTGGVESSIIGKNDLVGDPISCSSGQSIQDDTIYIDSGPDPLTYILNYKTQIIPDDPISQPCEARSSNHSKSVSKVFDRDGLVLYQVSYSSTENCDPVEQMGGYSYTYFSVNGGTFSSNAINAGSFVVNTDGSKTETSKKGKVTTYDVNGQVSGKESGGKVKTYTYTHHPSRCRF